MLVQVVVQAMLLVVVEEVLVLVEGVLVVAVAQTQMTRMERLQMNCRQAPQPRYLRRPFPLP